MDIRNSQTAQRSIVLIVYVEVVKVHSPGSCANSLPLLSALKIPNRYGNCRGHDVLCKTPEDSLYSQVAPAGVCYTAMSALHASWAGYVIPRK